MAGLKHQHTVACRKRIHYGRFPGEVAPTEDGFIANGDKVKVLAERDPAPVIDTVAVQDPAVVFITGNYPASPQVVEATNPDEYGIFTSLDNPREKNEPGKKVYRKGYRTVTWRAHDDNGDNLRYSVSFRPKGSCARSRATSS